MGSKTEILTGGQKSLCALYNRPVDVGDPDRSRTLVVMAHGFPGGHKSAHDDLYGELQSALTRREFHTLRFDFRGCGESEGFEEHFTLDSAREDFRHIHLWAREQGYKNMAYIGEGLGASLALLSLDLNISALVLLWPVLDLRAHADRLTDGLQITDTDRHNGYIDYEGCRMSLRLLKELQTTSLISCMRDAFMPTMILHGTRDAVVPIKDLSLAKSYITARRIDITTVHDGEHGLAKPNHRRMVLHHIGDFLEKYA